MDGDTDRTIRASPDAGRDTVADGGWDGFGVEDPLLSLDGDGDGDGDADGDGEGTPDPDARVCVVAVVDYTFEQCRNGFYPAPVDYPRTERAFDWLGLYRTVPTSAITHVAPVTDRFVDDGTWMGHDRYEKLIGRFSEAEEAVVFALGDLHELADPVANDRNGVRGAWYCRLRDLVAATTLSELSTRAET